jgi:hypothetical protein
MSKERKAILSDERTIGPDDVAKGVCDVATNARLRGPKSVRAVIGIHFAGRWDDRILTGKKIQPQFFFFSTNQRIAEDMPYWFTIILIFIVGSLLSKFHIDFLYEYRQIKLLLLLCSKNRVMSIDDEIRMERPMKALFKELNDRQWFRPLIMENAMTHAKFALPTKLSIWKSAVVSNHRKSNRQVAMRRFFNQKVPNCIPMNHIILTFLNFLEWRWFWSGDCRRQFPES